MFNDDTNDSIPINTTIKKDVYVTEFEQIDEKTLDIFHDETRKKLESKKEYIWDEYTADVWRYEGRYLLVKKDGIDNEFYNIYTRSYLGKNTNIKVYAAVKFTNLKLADNGIVLNSFNSSLYAPMLFINGGTSSFVYGYQSLEELYNKVLRQKTDEYEIKADIGMYMEN